MMTRDEAEAAARKGAKVRHEDWQPDEWIELRKGGAQFDEQGGHLLHAFDFYGPDYGWSIVEPAPAQAPVEPDLAARVAELEAISNATSVLLGMAVAAIHALQFPEPAPTFTTSRKPDAPGVMGDEEIADTAVEMARHNASMGLQTLKPEVFAAREAIRLTRQSVLAQLTANEERAFEVFWRAYNAESPDAGDRNRAGHGIRAALAAIREGL